jgi:peroxiredoxin
MIKHFVSFIERVFHNGRVIKVFYPVFPPDQHAAEVLAWLSEHPQTGEEGQRRVD